MLAEGRKLMSHITTKHSSPLREILHSQAVKGEFGIFGEGKLLLYLPLIAESRFFPWAF